MSRSTWKRTEREVAERLGGRRVPVTGRARGDAPDIEHGLLSPEVKHRKEVPRWLADAMAQAEAAARDGRVPVAVIHRHGDRHDDSLCLIRLSDLVRLIDGSGARKEA